MKKLEHLIDFFDIKISTFVILLLAFLTGKFKTILVFLIISFIHELGHLCACFAFKVKTVKMNVLPFGFNLEIKEMSTIKIIHELIIYLSGPATYFFVLFVIQIIYKQNYISYVTYEFAKNANLAINLFNLLPIYPLDGFRVLDCIYQYFFSYKYSLKIAFVTSIVFFIFLIFQTIKNPQLVIVFFLFTMQIKFFKEIPLLYKKFIIHKTYYKKHKKYKIIKNYNMYKEKNNYQIENGKMLNDVQIAKKILKDL